MFVVVYKAPNKYVTYFAGPGKPLARKITGALVFPEQLRGQFQGLCDNQECMFLKDVYFSNIAGLMGGEIGILYSDGAKW